MKLLLCELVESAMLVLKKKIFIKHKHKESFMTKEVVKHRKDEKKKPALSAKEKKAKKQEKKKSKGS
jgi:hypothetical protein